MRKKMNNGFRLSVSACMTDRILLIIKGIDWAVDISIVRHFREVGF
jgi:hypothetical protein